MRVNNAIALLVSLVNAGKLSTEDALLHLQGMSTRRSHTDPERVTASREEGSPWPLGFAQGPTIKEAFDRYHTEFNHRSRVFVYQNQRAFNLFLRVNAMDEAWPISTITKERCLTWKQAMVSGTAMPTHRKYRKAGAVTISIALGHMRRFTKWAVQNDLLKSDPMNGVTLPARQVSNAKIRKEGFSDPELRRILDALAGLRSEPGPGRPKQDPIRKEWCFCGVLLAFTGARVMEIGQLRKENVFQEDGIWCLKITDDYPGQKLKNRPSKRIIPIHSQVVKFGFIRWMKEQPDGWLFPRLQGYGASKPSRFFGDMARRLGVYSPTKTLHSLRHTMTIKLERARVHYSIMRRLLGHTVGNSVEDRIYLGSLTYSAKELSEALESIQMPPIVP